MPHEFDGEKYRQSSTHQKEWGNKIIAEFSLKGNERILDLGCGDGVLTAQLAELVPEGYVLGIDASRGMLEAALTISRSNLVFKLQDINSLDYEEQFDLVFSNATLHWIKNHNQLLTSVNGCLKRGGQVRFNFAAEGNCSNLVKVVRMAMSLPQYAALFKSFEWPWYMPALEEYGVLAKQIPFSETRVWGENADRYFPDAAAITKWIDQPSLVPFLEHLGQPEKSGFRNYVVEKMLESTLQNDGRCFETFRRINFWAKK